METIPSLKQCAAWAIGLTDKYRYNPFIRTAVHITVLQIVLAIIMIAIFSWAIDYAQDRTLSSINEHVTDLATGSDPEDLSTAIREVRAHAYELVFFIILALNALFGYFMARFALRPTRHSIAAQKQFIGNIAHELRTPLAIIKTNTEVALFDPKLDPVVKQTFEDTLHELDRISEIINNLLTFDTMTRPRRLEFEPIDVRQVAETVLRRHLALAKERGIRLAMDSGGPAIIDGNQTALEQVLTNLVKNAINYTPQHKDGSVRIIIEPGEEGRTVVTVADTGIGIAQKDLFHIFEPFYRGDTSRARGVGSGTSGLGLAIVNELVRLHKGSITIRSALGRGTAIKITFPPVSRTTVNRVLPSEQGGMHEVSLDFS
ncbi:MAG TPA: HAMP domain-containing sensor histidine kinase [Candidatus Paceibacterota bacterium]|nr:HAMP domain-containing sensor histidine kinase [Candidatus Paceibacterota bacterium]